MENKRFTQQFNQQKQFNQVPKQPKKKQTLGVLIIIILLFVVIGAIVLSIKGSNKTEAPKQEQKLSKEEEQLKRQEEIQQLKEDKNKTEDEKDREINEEAVKSRTEYKGNEVESNYLKEYNISKLITINEVSNETKPIIYLLQPRGTNYDEFSDSFASVIQKGYTLALGIDEKEPDLPGFKDVYYLATGGGGIPEDTIGYVVTVDKEIDPLGVLKKNQDVKTWLEQQKGVR